MNPSRRRSERSEPFLVTSANLLIETNRYKDRHLRIPAQHDRLDAHIQAFRWIEADHARQFGAQAIKVIGLQELQIDGEHDNGETIRRELGYEFGTWQAHSRKKHGEHIGAVSNVAPDKYDHIPLDHNRHALALWFGETCVTIVHPMYSDADRRRNQYGALMEHLADQEHSIVMGDFNEDPALLFRPFGAASRHKLGSLGLRSAFVDTNGSHPVTLPSHSYGQYRSPKTRLGYALVGGGLCLDDVYVSEDISVRNTGTIDTESDHRFVYADLRVHQSDIILP